MDLSQAIGNLFNQEEGDKSEDSKLSDLLSRIAQLLPDVASSNPDSDQGAEILYRQLTDAARSGQNDLFLELVKAEKTQPPSNEPTLLMAAVLAHQHEVVKALVAAGADVNAKIKKFFEFNALNLAVSEENIAITQTLLEAGADPNWINASPGLAPITKAIQKNNTELVRLLLDHNASVIFKTNAKPLVVAAQHDNPDIINLLLEAGCDINSRDSSRHSALQEACLHCNVETIKALLLAGAKLRSSGDELFSIFYAPGYVKQLSGLIGEKTDPTPKIPIALQALIEAGVDLNIANNTGITVLALAIHYGSLDIIKLLLAAGADANLPCQLFASWVLGNSELHDLTREYACGTTAPLNLAVAFGRLEMAQVLLDAGADPRFIDQKGRTALKIATKEGHQDIITLLKNAGAPESSEVIEHSSDTLLGAAKKGNLELLSSALAAGADPNISQVSAGRQRREKTALMFAAERGHLDVVKRLLEAGAEVNLSDRPGKKFGKTPLMYAAQSDQAEVLKYFLDAGAVVDAQDKRGQTALFYAVEAKAAAAVEVLLIYGADIHKKSWEGTPFEEASYSNSQITKLITTADHQRSSEMSAEARVEMLSSAAFSGNADLVRDLIHQGVDINATDKDGGWTALMNGAARGHITVVQLLLAAGAEIDQELPADTTALSEAAYWGRTEVVKLLISAGADINSTNSSGRTPIMQTLAWNSTEVLQILLDAGADASARNEDGKTVLAMATADGKTAIENILRQAGVTE